VCHSQELQSQAADDETHHAKTARQTHVLQLVEKASKETSAISASEETSHDGDVSARGFVCDHGTEKKR